MYWIKRWEEKGLILYELEIKSGWMWEKIEEILLGGRWKYNKMLCRWSVNVWVSLITLRIEWCVEAACEVYVGGKGEMKRKKGIKDGKIYQN
jgi:hypothetical protein